MGTLSIFNSWDTYPTIFLNVEKSTNLITSRLKLSPFYSCPNQLYDLSMIKLLSSRFGILKNGKNTFKTGSINTKNITSFNNYFMRLKLQNKKVILEVFINNKFIPFCDWDIITLTKRLKSKNNNNRLITQKSVIELIETGKLSVSFNVSDIKDHGTKWTISK